MFCQNLLFGGYTGHSSPSLNNLPLPEETKSTEMCGHSAPDMFSEVLIREGESFPSTCWLHFCLYCPEGCCLFLHQDPQVLPCKTTFRWVELQPVLVHGIFLPKRQELAFHFVELHEASVSPFLQSAEVSLNSSPALHHIDCSLNFVSSANLLWVLSIPSIRSLINVLNWSWLQLALHWLMTGCQPCFVLLITSHWAWLSSQVSTYLIIHWSKSW